LRQAVNCFEFQNWIQRRLDGDFNLGSPGLDAHLAGCASCRRLDAAAHRLEAALSLVTPATPPSGLAGRIVTRLLAERRARMRFRRGLLTGAAAAATVVVALLSYSRLGGPASKPAPIQTVDLEPAPQPRTPVSLQASVREAGTALAALVGRTADEAVEQSRALLPAGLPRQAAFDADSLALDPPVRSLREAGQGLSAGLEPVTSSARRAVDLFLREMPGEVKSKK
jgi:predicted anti-sigma-YlaC factor YlaD